jgi:predicted aspartyl protease
MEFRREAGGCRETRGAVPASTRRLRAGTLLPAVLAVGCVVSGSPPSEESPPSRVVRMLDFDGRPVVEATLAGRGPFRFILDTGADASVIDASLAERIELPTVGEEEVGSPLGGTVRARRVRMGDVVVSGVELGTLDALEVDLAAVIGGGDAPVGVLSTATFAGRSLTFDFARQRLVAADAPLPAADGVHVFDFCASDGKPSVNVEVGGQAYCVDVDTGSPAILALPLTAAESLPLAGEPAVRGHARLVGAEIAVWGAQLDGDLRVGELSLHDPELTFHEKAPIGNLGRGFLRQVELTVDHASQRVRVRAAGSVATPASARPAPLRLVAPGAQKRYGMRFRGSIGGDLVVAGVDPGSPAEAGGVHAGDRVLALNGKEVDELGVSERIQALRASPLHLRLEHDGKPREVHLRLD